jgi:hypothetical protein
MKAVLLRRSDAAAGDGEISSLHEVQVRFLDKKQ